VRWSFVPLSLAVVLAGCGPVLCKGAACHADAGDGSLTGSKCGTCPALYPVCDEASATCVTCTSLHGCGGATGVCDTTANSGKGQCVACTEQKGCLGATPNCFTLDGPPRCVECLKDDQCDSHQCNQFTQTCVKVDAGTSDWGTDGGTDADAGTSTTLDGGACINHAAPAACTQECARGFTCVNNSCVLNGGGGAIQVTLRWDTDEDLDLHVLEPTSGGPCDIYYGNTGGTACGAQGSLDLDSNAGCSIDSVDIENVIYPQGSIPTSGTYTVKVDYYQNCTSTLTVVPFEVEVRTPNGPLGYCGAFHKGQTGWSDSGGASSGRTVLTFTIP
jgi:hypothetical protein